MMYDHDKQLDDADATAADSASADSPNGDTQIGDAANGDGEDNEPVVHKHHVRRRISGRRLDKYLQGRYSHISRTTIQRYIKQGQVTVNSMPTKASYEPATGDLISITLPPPPPTHLVAEDIPLDIIYEDQWMLAINKQPGIVCHPARATQSGTVANAVAFHAEQLSKGSDPFRPRHRTPVGQEHDRRDGDRQSRRSPLAHRPPV